MPKRVDDAIQKCMREMMKRGLSAQEAKSRCIGRFKNIGILKKKGPGLEETKRGKEKLKKKGD